MEFEKKGIDIWVINPNKTEENQANNFEYFKEAQSFSS